MVRSRVAGRVAAICGWCPVDVLHDSSRCGIRGRALEEKRRENPSSVLAMKSCNLTRNKELVKLIVMSVMSV